MNSLIQEHVSLADKTTFRIGGMARYYAHVGTVTDLQQVVAWARENNIQLYWLGGGSNLLIHDDGIDGLVVKLKIDGEFGQIEQCDHDALSWRVGCAVSLPALVRKTAESGCAGLEKLSGIPGSFGGALKMNAGVPETSIGDHVRGVTTLDHTGQLRRLDRDALGFSYRHSLLGDALALSAELLLPHKLSPESLIASMRQQRHGKTMMQPVTLRSAGCIFKNPSGTPAGRLIDQAGCKGLRQGGAEVSSIHANFIVNTGQATAADVSMLIKEVRERVHANHGVWLDLEIKTWGFDNDDFFT